MITNIAERRDVRNRVIELTEQNRTLYGIQCIAYVMSHDYIRFREKHFAKHGWIPGEGSQIRGMTAQAKIKLSRNKMAAIHEDLCRRCEYQDTLYAVLKEIDAGMPTEDAWKWLEDVWRYYNP